MLSRARRLGSQVVPTRCLDIINDSLRALSRGIYDQHHKSL